MARHLDEKKPENPGAEAIEAAEAGMEAPATPSPAATGEQEEHKRLFEDFSFAQVLASSLSAVTSVLLSQQIGLIGGLLGVAAGAAIAAIATQAYRSVLTVSAERLREQIIIVPSHDGGAEPDKTAKLPEAQFQKTETLKPAVEDKTVVSNQREGLPAILRSKAGIALLIAAVSLAAVAIVAFTINTATKGQGLGERVIIIQQPAEQAPADELPEEESVPEDEAEQPKDEQEAPEQEAPEQDQGSQTEPSQPETPDQTAPESEESSPDQGGTTPEGEDGAVDPVEQGGQGEGTPEEGASPAPAPAAP